MSTTTTTRILYAPANRNIATRASAWIWPLPRLDGVEPHLLGPADEQSQRVEIGYPSRSSAPGLVPVFAAHHGVIAYAGGGDDGPTLCIDHPGGWSTQYSALAHFLARPTDRFRRRRKERVHAGDVIGHARPAALRIGFALSRLTDDECIAVDPIGWMHRWAAQPWFTDTTEIVVASDATTRGPDAHSS